ncbi:hypothetical protein HAHE_25950 [Haloferula helveola]|uniref:Uncharacterized protein n=1 Tax=Haloferula helveola TaxID=490095 RepID=A0ABM7RB31_9BACT|nr:hypothetical protein HAHE_25950 [Haloferula helveola]
MRFIAAIGALAFTACEKQSEGLQQPAEAQEAPWGDDHPLGPLFASGDAVYVAPADSLGELLESNESVTFLSRQGELANMDSDTALTLRSDGTVVLRESGIGSLPYSGKLVVRADGGIALDLQGYPATWPLMRFERLGDTCYLHRVDGETGFIFGGRTGAVTSADMKPFWPFALLDHEFQPQPE